MQELRNLQELQNKWKIALMKREAMINTLNLQINEGMKTWVHPDEIWDLINDRETWNEVNKKKLYIRSGKHKRIKHAEYGSASHSIRPWYHDLHLLSNQTI